MPTVSVVIPTWNGRKQLARCLEALRSQTLLPNQIIVVDNASTDETIKWIHTHHPEVHLIPLKENRGTAGGWNVGLHEATGDYIALLNNDAYPTPTWLNRLVAALESQPEFSFAACRLLLADGSDYIDSAGDGFDPLFGGVMLGHGQPNASPFDQPKEVFGATGAAAIYRKAVFETVGEFDESLFMYSDDIDMSFRAQSKGYRCLYVPDAIAYHERGKTIGSGSVNQIRLIYRNGLTVYLKNMPWPLLRSIWPQVLRRWCGALRHTPHPSATLWGVMEALLRLPSTLRKRRQIQRSRTAGLERLCAVMTGTTQSS